MTKSEKLEKRRERDAIIFFLFGFTGIITTIWYAFYISKVPEMLTVEGSFEDNVWRAVPLFMCVGLAQFFTLGIGLVRKKFHVLRAAIVYAVIIAVIGAIVMIKLDKMNFIVGTLFYLLLCVAFASVAFLLAAPMYLFAYLYEKIPSTTLITLIYFPVTCFVFIFGFAFLMTNLWFIFVIIAGVVLTIIGLSQADSSYSPSVGGTSSSSSSNSSSSQSANENDYYFTSYDYEYYMEDIRTVGDHYECNLSFTVYFNYKNAKGKTYRTDLKSGVGGVRCDADHESIIESHIERNYSSKMGKYSLWS